MVRVKNGFFTVFSGFRDAYLADFPTSPVPLIYVGRLARTLF